MDNKKQEVGELFNSILTPYEVIVNSNFMCHKELYEKLEKILLKLNHPFSLVDLGCNNANYISKALINTSIFEYIGVDLADKVFDAASKNLDELNCTKEFINQDLLSYIKNIDRKFDVIFLSFSLHHLTFQEKKEFIQQCNHRLSLKGKIIVIDIFKSKQQSDAEFNQKMVALLGPVLKELSEKDRDDITTHIINYDNPGSAEEFSVIAKDAGLIYENHFTIEMFNISEFKKHS